MTSPESKNLDIEFGVRYSFTMLINITILITHAHEQQFIVCS